MRKVENTVPRGRGRLSERRLAFVGAEMLANLRIKEGNHRGKLNGLVDFCICVPSEVTTRIQECHSLVGHVLSGYCEKELAVETVASARG